MNATEPYGWHFNVGLSNGSVPSDNKPLPEPILVQDYVAICRHQARMWHGNVLDDYYWECDMVML